MDRQGLYFSLPIAILSLLFLWLFNRTPSVIFVFLFAGGFLLACLVGLFFRDPERKIPQGDDLILSPADGTVQRIKSVNGQIIISIFLSIFNVHVNRIPVAGNIKRVVHKSGRFLAAFREDASDINERNEIEIENPGGNITVHQIAGVLARRVVCRVKEGQIVKAGDRFGLIRFGSRVDLYLPEAISIQVVKGQRVKGGLTVIGKWQ
jgi:phosphatidylserine decarboxylase